MGANGWTWLVVAATFALYVAVALWSKARSTAEYYVADRSISPIVNGLATGADWMSAASFLSMAGLVAVTGRDGAAYLMGWTGGYVLLAVLLAPYLRKYGKYTVPQFVGERYYSGGARLLALALALLISFTYVVAQVRGVGVVFARFLDVSVGTGVLWAAAAVLLYTVLGGMKGITHAQVAQYAVIVVAFLLPAIAASSRLTGNPVPPLGLGSTLTAAGAAELGSAPGVHLLGAIDRVSVDLGFPPYTSGWRPRQDVLAVAAVLMFGTAGLPHILVRFFTVPKIRDARATAAWALVFIAVLYLTAPAVAAFARAGLVSTVNGVAYDERPEWFRRWERTGLASFVDRDGDGRMTLAADPERNEVRVDPDVLVIAHAELAGVAPWVVGLVAAGALAAGLSTAAGLLLVIASRTTSCAAGSRPGSGSAPSSGGRAAPPPRWRCSPRCSRSGRRAPSRRWSPSRSASPPRRSSRRSSRGSSGGAPRARARWPACWPGSRSPSATWASSAGSTRGGRGRGAGGSASRPKASARSASS